jgi:hypothetical protein
MRSGARHSQLASHFLDLPGGHYDDPNSGAVDVRHSGQVDNNFFSSLFHQVLDGPFQFLAVPADGDSSENSDVWWQLLGLNLEHERHPFRTKFDEL